jgi:hypothetical protein
MTTLFNPACPVSQVYLAICIWPSRLVLEEIPMSTSALSGLELSVSPQAELLLHAAGLAVAAVARPEAQQPDDAAPPATETPDTPPAARKLLTLTPADQSWRVDLAELAEQVTAADRAIIGAHLSMHNPRLPAPELLTGPPQRRIDAVLDLLDTPFSANDVQNTAAEYGASLAQVEVPAHWSSATTGVSVVGGAMGGFFGVPMGYKAGDVTERGMLWWLGRTELSPKLLQRLVDGLVQAVAFDKTGPADTTPLQELHATWLAELQESTARAARHHLSADSKDAQREVQARSAALTYLRSTQKGTATWAAPSHRMPDVVGRSLTDAEFLLNVSGITATFTDVRADSRLLGGIRAKDHWVVTSQAPDSGSENVHGAQLQVLKFTERH